MPVRMEVGAVDLDLPVAAIGVGTDGLLSLPPNPSTIGWYEYGPTTAAGAGSTLLAGHLDSLRYGLGPLVRLRDVGRGDVITITTASGRDYRYKVSDVQRVRKADLDGLGVFDRSGAPLLRVVTCGGPFDPDTGYRDNLVVTATPAD
jgi:sortase (surface protein transpeptidase)